MTPPELDRETFEATFSNVKLVQLGHACQTINETYVKHFVSVSNMYMCVCV